jgi:hypothetical protein
MQGRFIKKKKKFRIFLTTKIFHILKRMRRRVICDGRSFKELKKLWRDDRRRTTET